MVLVVSAAAFGVAGAGRATGGDPPLWLFSAYASSAGTAEQIFTSDGGPWSKLGPAGSFASRPSWAPDGTRVAYLVTRDPGGSSETDEVVVANADGSDPRRLTDGASAQLLGWSPDGTRLGYVARGGIWVVSADGGVPMRVAGDAAAAALDWSPDGQSLLYTTTAAAIVIASVETGATRQVAQAGGSPAEDPARFSPDGSEVAYMDGHLHLRLVESDGTGDRLATSVPAFDFEWAPNGELVFDSSIDARGNGFDPRYAGAPVETSLWEVQANGDGVARRLTGPYADTFHATDFGTDAAFSRDGSRITYHHGEEIWEANGDGTCARPVPSYTNIPFGPYWNPTVAARRVSCVDLLAFATGPHAFVRGRTAYVVVHVENHGSEPATNVEVKLESEGKAHLGSCSPLCHIARIGPRATRLITVPYEPLHAGSGGLAFSVESAQRNYTARDLSGSWIRSIRRR